VRPDAERVLMEEELAHKIAASIKKAQHDVEGELEIEEIVQIVCQVLRENHDILHTMSQLPMFESR